MSYLNSNYTLKDIRFKSGNIELIFTDGRLLVTPLNHFPEIKKLTAKQRNKYHIIGGEGFDFDDSDEVYHIADFIGNILTGSMNERTQSLVSEPISKHNRNKKNI